MRQELIMVISQKKQTNKYKEKLVIFQSIGIIVIKSKETSYTCRYSRGHLIPIIQPCHPCFLTFITDPYRP